MSHEQQIKTTHNQKEFQAYKTIYGLISNPKTKDMKFKAFESLIYSTFLDTNSTKITISDIEKYAQKNSLKISSNLILLKSAEILAEQKIINLIDKNTLELVNTEFLTKFDKMKSENEKKLIDFHDFMISSLQNFFKEIFTEDIKKYIKEVIENILSEILDSYSESVIEIYNGNFTFSYTEDIDVLIKKYINELKLKDYKFSDDLEIALKRVFNKQFITPHSTFANALRLFTIRKIMSKIILKNPSMESIKKDFFKDVKIFIDNNVLISLLCKASSFHEITNDLLFETRKLEGKILLSQWTLNEFTNSLDNAKHIYQQIEKGKLHLFNVDNEIIRSYYDLPDDKRDWLEFNKELRNNLENLLKSDMIELRECTEPDLTKLTRLENILINEYSKRNIEKRKSLITHDSKMMLYIQESRGGRNLTIGTYWFLSRDEKLRKIEKINLQKIGFFSECLISCDIWFEILLPFVDTEYEEDEISKAFSKLLGISIMTVPYDVVDSYVKHLSVEMHINEQESLILKRRIEDIHLRNTLELAIIDKDFEAANFLLKESLETLKEKRDSDKTIHKLSAQIRELKILKKTTISEDELKKLKHNVNIASTNDEKGKTLEKLAEYLFGKINGLIIIDTDVRLEAEEIDILISNSAFDHWSDPIIVECKNWRNPVPAKEISNLIEKIRTNASKTGVLIAINGITGDEYKDAGRKIRDALVRDQIRILVITWEDIIKINNEKDWIELLYSRYYKIYDFFKNKGIDIQFDI